MKIRRQASRPASLFLKKRSLLAVFLLIALLFLVVLLVLLALVLITVLHERTPPFDSRGHPPAARLSPCAAQAAGRYPPVGSEIFLPADIKFIQKNKIFVDKGGGGWYTKLTKQRRPTASASPPALCEEVHRACSRLPETVVCCCADALRYPRFVIFRMEVL